MICHGHGSATDNGSCVPWWRSRSSMVLCGFLLVAGFYLLTEHTAHVYGVLSYLLLLSCPQMHLIMHQGHGGTHDSGGQTKGGQQ